MQIQKAELKDLPQMMIIYQRAREFMRETGNPDQWKDSYPQEEVVRRGIEEGKAWLCTADGPEDGQAASTRHIAAQSDAQALLQK